ncbi:MAG: hypothetical protein V7607_3226 [Solirubrobacteraceae bacterium]
MGALLPYSCARCGGAADSVLCDECAGGPPPWRAAHARKLNGSEPAAEAFALLTADELLTMPPASWLVDGLVPANGLSVLYGASGTCKSFLAMDWALCTASGLPWHGHAVERRWTVYVAAEGRAGLGARYHAWATARGWPDASRIRFLAEAVNLRDAGQVERARRTLASLPERPGLIVIDTMARAIPGGDENAAKDVGEFIAAVDGLRGDDAVLVVHHSGKDGRDERGSSALRGAAEMMAKLKRDERSPRVALSCDKLKDGAEWATLDLALEASASSCVLALRVEAKSDDHLHQRVLAFVAEQGPVSQNRVEREITGRAADLREALRALQANDLIHKTDSGWRVRPTPPDAPGRTPHPAPGRAVRPEAPITPKGWGPGTHPEPRPDKPRPDDQDEPERTLDAVIAEDGIGVLLDAFDAVEIDAARTDASVALDMNRYLALARRGASPVVFDRSTRSGYWREAVALDDDERETLLDRQEDRYVTGRQAAGLLGIERRELTNLWRGGKLVPATGIEPATLRAARERLSYIGRSPDELPRSAPPPMWLRSQLDAFKQARR